MNDAKQVSILPVIKWTGSKRCLMPKLSKLITTPIRNFYDPFLGGGSSLPYFDSKLQSVGGDVIPELIDLWRMIRNCPEDLYEGYRKNWDRLQAEGNQVYYEIRDSFNVTRNPIDFLFLSRTCANGLIRFNNSGNFNTSFHLTRKGINPNGLRKLLLSWSKIVQYTLFFNGDYRDTLSEVNDNDFVFLDPPYMKSGSMYRNSNAFNYHDFHKELERLNQVGAKWMLTFDAKSRLKEGEEIPVDLYKSTFQINSGISSFPRMRGVTKDVLESVYTNFKLEETIK